MVAITKDDLSKELEGHLGKVGAMLAEHRKETLEKVAQMDARILALPSTGTRGSAKARYLDGLNGGKPKDVDHRETVEEVIERLREEEAVEHVRVLGIGRMPLLKTLPRGLAGVRDSRGLLAARLIRAMALTVARDRGISVDNVLETAHRAWGGNDQATGYLEGMRDLHKAVAGSDEKARAEAQRALGTAILGDGASFVQPEVWSSFMDFLFPMSVVSSLGAQSVPIKNGLLFNFFDGAVTAAYVGENAGTTESSPTDGQMAVTRKILQAICALSNELLEEASWSVDALLRQHLGRALMAKRDLKLIEGRGTSHEPHGLDFWVEQPTTAHYDDRTLDTGAVTYETVRNDFFAGLQVITDENLPIEASEGARPGVIMSNGVKYGLMKCVVGTDVRTPFETEMRGGTIMGMPYKASTQITKTRAGDGAGHGTNNKSSIYIGDFSNFLIAEDESVKIEAFRGGAYKDANGNVVSGITNRETVIAAENKHEGIELYRGKSFYRIDSVDFQAATWAS